MILLHLFFYINIKTSFKEIRLIRRTDFLLSLLRAMDILLDRELNKNVQLDMVLLFLTLTIGALGLEKKKIFLYHRTQTE